MAEHAAAGEIALDLERFPLQRIEDPWERQARGSHEKIVLTL